VVAAAPAASTIDLDAMLAAAGLQMASTDPAKLRAAQEAASQFVPVVRVPRARKPVAPVSSEPLVQVETQR
jgi:ribonuclease E